jgi:transcription-repair coupling factor (superfamily II helicase)
VLTTVNAALQRVPEQALVAAGSLSAAAGNVIPMADLVAWLEGNGFMRNPTVREPGEYAVRGGILDLYAAGTEAPFRLDYFGDTLESIRTFDPDTQLTIDRQARIDLVPVSEMTLSPESVARFRQRYVALFGAADRGDLLYHAVSEGRRYVGMEHWLPLFADGLETVFDHIDDAPVVLDHLAVEAGAERLDQIADHYQARRAGEDAGLEGGGAPYKPLPPDRLYLTRDEWELRLADAPDGARISPFAQPEAASTVDAGGHAGRSFAAERGDPSANVFDAVIAHVGSLTDAGKRVVVACWSDGSRDRMGQVLVDHGLTRLKPVASWPEATALDADMVALAVLGLESGFETGRRCRYRRAGHPRRPARASARQAPRLELPVRCHRARRGRHRRPHRPRHRPLHRSPDHRGGRRAARLPRTDLRRRRPGLPAGREHRAAVALRLGGCRRSARQARRRRLAGAEGADEEAHPRDGGGADQDRRGAA